MVHHRVPFWGVYQCVRITQIRHLLCWDQIINYYSENSVQLAYLLKVNEMFHSHLMVSALDWYCYIDHIISPLVIWALVNSFKTKLPITWRNMLGMRGHNQDVSLDKSQERFVMFSYFSMMQMKNPHNLIV